MDHELDIQVNHGTDASLYLGVCSCGWISGDGRDKESIRTEHRQHVEGRKPPWIMEPGERPGWEEDRDQVQVGFRAKKKPAAPGEGRRALNRPARPSVEPGQQTCL